MKKTNGTVLLAGVLLALLATPAYAIISFTQLDENTFTVSHRVKGLGSRGKATRLVFTKAASLCVAAGYSYYQLLDQKSEASQQYQAANATVTVRFFFDDGQNRISCDSGSDPEYVEEARNKLQGRGYSPPEPEQAEPTPDSASAAQPEQPDASGACPQGCTIEQIAAMARSGLSDEQIRAACEAADARASGNSLN